MTFTPGPWRWVSGTDGDGSACEDLVGADDCGLLESGYFVRGDDVNEANARLIAAAPDLFDALMVFRDYFNEWGTPVLGTRMASVFEQAHAAIAKATGEAQS